MGSNLQKIKELLGNSELSAQDKEYFVLILMTAVDLDLDPLVSVLQRDPKMAVMLLKNYRAKLNAYTKGDPKLWEDILEEEEAELGKV